MKIFWFDTETTGLNPFQNDIVSLGYIIETPKGIEDKGIVYMKPTNMDNVSEEALKVNNLTLEQIANFPEAAEVVEGLIRKFKSFVDPYDPSDKFIPAGYNIRFDMDFLRKLWSKTKKQYFGSWFFFPAISVEAFVALEIAKGKCTLSSHKLEELCSFYEIPLHAHDALEDITATRELFLKLHGPVF